MKTIQEAITIAKRGKESICKSDDGMTYILNYDYSNDTIKTSLKTDNLGIININFDLPANGWEIN